MHRSGSVATGLSVGAFGATSSRYQKAIASVNVVLIITSLCITFYGGVLINVYYMDTLSFVDSNFAILPWGLVGVGIGTFLVSIYGFITASSEAKRHFISQGVMLIVCLLTLIYLIFIGFNISATISRQVLKDSHIEARERYFQSDPKYPGFKSDMDKISKGLRCCGFTKNGYEDFNFQGLWGDGKESERKKKLGTENCVPESCCVQPTCQGVKSRGCVHGMRMEDKIWRNVYVIGCMEVLQVLYTEKLEDGLTWTCVAGMAVVFIEITAIALAFAFVSRIRRKYGQSKPYKEANRRWEGMEMTGGGRSTNID